MHAINNMLAQSSAKAGGVGIGHAYILIEVEHRQL